MNKSEKHITTKNLQGINRDRATKVIEAFQHNSNQYEKNRTLGEELRSTKESTRMNEKTIRIIPFTAEE